MAEVRVGPRVMPRPMHFADMAASPAALSVPLSSLSGDACAPQLAMSPTVLKLMPMRPTTPGPRSARRAPTPVIA